MQKIMVSRGDDIELTTKTNHSLIRTPSRMSSFAFPLKLRVVVHAIIMVLRSLRQEDSDLRSAGLHCKNLFQKPKSLRTGMACT
jgi:hypothetical protein